MSDQSRDVAPGLNPRTVRTAQGQLQVPADWELLPPGDAALTRRVKLAGPCWTVSEKKGRKVFGRGVWASSETIARLRTELEAERADPAYAKKLAAGRQRRQQAQVAYVEDFRGAVLEFLAFAPSYTELAERMATAVTEHATPVGSGTVARTERIPLEERAAAAVIAWLRHRTTGYDTMTIARVKGRRREVRRQLAEQSRRLLVRYRAGAAVDPACPLQRAFAELGADPVAARSPDRQLTDSTTASPPRRTR